LKAAGESLISGQGQVSQKKGFPGAYWIRSLSDATPLPIKWKNLNGGNLEGQELKTRLKEEIGKEQERYREKLIPDNRDKEQRIKDIRIELAKHKEGPPKDGKELEKAKLIQSDLEDTINDLANQIRWNNAVQAQCRAALFVLEN